MDKHKTLGDASHMMVEKHVKVIDSALAQYIKSSIQLLESQGKSIDDYALIQVNNPMVVKDDHSMVTITSQWRLIHVDKLENAPVWED